MISTTVEAFYNNAQALPETEVYVFLDGKDKQIRKVGALMQRAKAIASHLQKHCKKGDRALLVYPPGLDFLDAYWACLISGVIAVPVPMVPNPDMVRVYLEHTQADCDAKLILSNSVVNSIIQYQLGLHPNSNIPRNIILTNEIENASASNFRENIVDKNDIAFLQYTSGSTAKPKGVIVKHSNLLENVNAIDRFTGILEKKDGELVMGAGGSAWLPHFHDMGLVGHFIIPVVAPGPIYFMSPLSFIEKPLRWLQSISDYGTTISAAPNFAYQLCSKKITKEEKQQLDLSSWKVALTGSEPIKADVLKAFTNAFAECGFDEKAFSPCYGMAETTLIISGRDKMSGYETKHLDIEQLKNHNISYTESDGLEIVGCGKVDENFDLKIVDSESGIALQDSEIGEVWLSGPSLTDGYWNKPIVNEKMFKAHLKDGSGPYFKTGDLGFIENEELYITGRLKDLIIVRGKNYYPQDIESIVYDASPEIRKGCVAAYGNEIYGQEQLVLAIEIKNSAVNPDFDLIVNNVFTAVNKNYNISPKEIYLIKADELPKTTSGKVQRQGCKKKLNNGLLKVLHKWQHTEIDTKLKNGALIQWMKNEVAAMTGISQKLVDEDKMIFDLGIESIQLPELIDRLKVHTGKEITVAQIVDRPTIKGIAGSIEANNNAIVKAVANNDTIQKENETILPDFNLLN